MQKKDLNKKTTKTSSAKRLDPNARRAQLLHHAMAAFADAGIERAVHADVAVRADVSTPTVFKYFPTRDALVDAILSEIETAFWDLGGIKSNNIQLGPKELARSLADSISELCVDRPNMMKVAITWAFGFSSTRERYEAFEKMRLDDLYPSFKPAGLTRMDARMFISSIFLFIRMHFDGTSRSARADYIDRVCQMLDRGSAHN